MNLKNICKTVKVFSLGIIIGETIVSYYKDENFRSSLKNTKGFDKCKVIFNNLVDVNKNLFIEIEQVDYAKLATKYKELFNLKLKDVENKLNEIKQQTNKLHDDKIKPLVEDITSKYEELKQIALEKKEDLIDTYQDKLKVLEEKIEEVKKEIKNKLSK